VIEFNAGFVKPNLKHARLKRYLESTTRKHQRALYHYGNLS